MMSIYTKCMLIICMLFLNDLNAQSIIDSQTKVKLETYLNDLEKVGFNGSVLVEVSGKKLLSRGYGFADKDSNVKNHSYTVFSIGSITKQFTATAILKLESEGKLSTEDTMAKYFDSVPIDKQNITIHDLLRHQSGFVSTIGGDYEAVTITDFINRVFNSKLQFSPATKFSYSNIGYSLLALIIEKVSGLDYEEYLHNALFKKVGMNLTGYSVPEFKPVNVAIGYRENFEVWGKPTEKEWNGQAPYLHLLGNGGMLSTTEDLYKWHKSLLNFEVLSESTTNKLYRPKLRLGENDNPYYAYGWDIFKTTRGTTQTWHNGTNGVFYAEFLRLIDEGIAVILLSNKSDRIFNSISNNIVKLIIEKDFKPIIPIPKTLENIQLTESVILAIQNIDFDAAKNLYLNKQKGSDIIESMLNQEGYRLLSEDNIKTAILVFEFNTYAFSNSANAYDSLGEAYFINKNYNQSLFNYQKSYELDSGNMNAKKIIDELLSQKVNEK